MDEYLTLPLEFRIFVICLKRGKSLIKAPFYSSFLCLFFVSTYSRLTLDSYLFFNLNFIFYGCTCRALSAPEGCNGS